MLAIYPELNQVVAYQQLTGNNKAWKNVKSPDFNGGNGDVAGKECM